MVKPDRSRYIWLYCKSKAQKEEWQALAKKADTPLSAWCAAIIEERIAEQEGGLPRHKIMKELKTLKDENKILRDDLRQKEIVLERHEGELRRYRSQPFLEEDYKGVRPYSEELVKILKDRREVDGYRLLELLGIKPNEAEAIKAIQKQLQELEGYGLVKTDGKDWQWMA
ncbi:Uncharacterised protein [uncultured archaeon]|nr:Uncharacterised protein [uncultured archaeon]